VIDKSDLNFLPTGPLKVVGSDVTDCHGAVIAKCADPLVARAIYAALVLSGATWGPPVREKTTKYYDDQWGPPWR
jgi:hypothetical protein